MSSLSASDNRAATSEGAAVTDSAVSESAMTESPAAETSAAETSPTGNSAAEDAAAEKAAADKFAAAQKAAQQKAAEQKAASEAKAAAQAAAEAAAEQAAAERVGEARRNRIQVSEAELAKLDHDHRYAISVQDVHITYRTIVDPRANTLRHTLTQLGKGKRSSGRKVREINAVRGVSLDVEHGSVLGVIGANGAGKSTLMRAIAGILPPSSGQIVVNGRISTLLALGVGFNGQLSGRENVILGGLAAGLTRKQVEERFEQIADWAELHEAIDMPMKSYSSGMYGRLAFAVSTHMEPDVLLVDEALSTGDAHFRRKSYDKMQELVAQARTILIVSHGLAAIREMCDDCIWMHKGEIVRRGNPDDVAAEYLEFQGVPPEPKRRDASEEASDFDDAFVMEDV